MAGLAAEGADIRRQNRILSNTLRTTRSTLLGAFVREYFAVPT
jgi:hypothetical protein